MVLSFFERKDLLLKAVIFSLCLKLIILFFLGAQPFLDGRAYIAIAEKIWENTFLYPSSEIRDAPGAPYLYALFYPLISLLGIKAFAIANIILASLTVYIAFKISCEIFEDIKVANITAVIFAIYPFFNFYAISILTETVYIFFLYLSILFLIRFIKTYSLKDLSLFSIFFAIDTLIRFANLSMFIFFIVLIVALLFKRKKDLLFIGKTVAIMIFFYGLTMSPWWIRNYSVFGEFVATSVGESGKVFYSGNNPLNKSGGGIGRVDVDFSEFKHITDPKLKDKAMWDAGIKWIKENPKDWVILELRKLKRLYSPIFYDKGYNKWYYNLISLLSYGVVFILFFVGIFKYREKWVLYSPMLLYALLLTGIHVVFIASIRYRLPIEPFMIIMAAPVVYDILKRYEKTN